MQGILAADRQVKVCFMMCSAREVLSLLIHVQLFSYYTNFRDGGYVCEACQRANKCCVIFQDHYL